MSTGIIVMTRTLKQVMPPEFSGGEYEDDRAQRYADVEVVQVYDSTRRGEGWPGKHKNVYRWVLLANGFAVGWNEYPARGWSFPVMRWVNPASSTQA